MCFPMSTARLTLETAPLISCVDGLHCQQISMALTCMGIHIIPELRNLSTLKTLLSFANISPKVTIPRNSWTTLTIRNSLKDEIMLR